jgi:two-component system NtrC family sensor kinase
LPDLARRLRSVRVRLLLIALLPPVVVLPLLLALVIHWGNDAYDRLLIHKVNAELVIAKQYLERVLEERRLSLEIGARSVGLAAALRGGADPRPLLVGMAAEAKFDFIHLLDAEGALRASSSGKLPGDRHAHWPVVGAALGGRGEVALDVFSAEELAQLSPAFAALARFAIVPTDRSASDQKTEETRGLLIHGSAPVRDATGRVVAVLEGGVLLNRNLDFVDRINDIVYTERALPLGSRGTVTLFLDDVRIATNVRMFEGERGEHPARALGTRVSLEVRDRVLGEGRTWLDRAFVVNDWYVSGYEPLPDSFGRRIGMLYVGYLEAPFASVKQQMLLAIGALVIAAALLAGVLGLRLARAVFRPLERMDATMRAAEAGDRSARIGPLAGDDEIARLAGDFDRLLDTLERRSAELQALNADLDRKVAERSAALTQAQQHLVRSEKLAAIGQLTAGVAHEINNPIAVMQGNLDLVRELLGPQAEAVATEIRLLDEQVNRIRVIVAKLLQFARPDEFAGFVDALDVNAVLADCLLLVRHEMKKSRIEIEQDLRATRRIEMNRNELQQVLINLIVNAVHAMPEGGSLRLTTEDGAGQGVRIRVRDSGVGIAAEHLERIFDPFFTTKKTQGTGLGLSVSLALVRRYGGTITVHSAVAAGSVFVVSLGGAAPEDTVLADAPGTRND